MGYGDEGLGLYGFDLSSAETDRSFGGSKGSSRKHLIMRTEYRLFDRGWVRFAMATRKCGNIYFPKYFMAVRPFLRGFFSRVIWVGGIKKNLNISSGAQSENVEPSLTIQEFFSKKYSWFYMQRMCTLFG